MLNDLRGKVNWRSYSLRDKLGRILNDFTHSKVSYFDFSLFSEKNVLKFEISMDDSFLMQIFDSIRDGCKDIPKLLFCEGFFFDSPFFDDLYDKKLTLEKSPFAAYSITI